MLYINYPSWLKPEIVPFLPIRWYGLMYIVAFGVAYFLTVRSLNREQNPLLNKRQTEDLFLSGIIGLLVGARLFYVFVYNFGEYMANPLAIIWPFSNGRFVGIQGLSFHGGVIGAAIGVAVYCYRHKIRILAAYDLVCRAIPFGYTFGRIGNFINAELYGKVSAGWFAMLFPHAEPVMAYHPWAQAIAAKTGIDISGKIAVNLPRYPSQLYEAFFEGLVLGLFLWFVIAPRKKFNGAVTAWFLMGYGLVRFFIEYMREPDSQLGFIIRLGKGGDTPEIFTSFLNFSMGQLLCLLMVAAGAALYFIARGQAFKKNGVQQGRKN
jgi:phosphatidylglycerol:prolipoprotein diacylglycerol transferase